MYQSYSDPAKSAWMVLGRSPHLFLNPKIVITTLINGMSIDGEVGGLLSDN